MKTDLSYLLGVFFWLCLFSFCSAQVPPPLSPSPVCREYYPLFVLSGKRRAHWLFMWSQSVFSWIFKEAVAPALCSLFVWLWLRSLSDRNEVTKLKFEGKTFHVYASQREVRAWIVRCWEKNLRIACSNVMYRLIFVSVCFIFLHVLLFSTCRTKRSSWRTLRPHLRRASTFGSVEWRTKLSISESTGQCFSSSSLKGSVMI